MLEMTLVIMLCKQQTPPLFLDSIFVQALQKASCCQITRRYRYHPLFPLLHNIILHLTPTSLMLNCLSLDISVHVNTCHVSVTAGKSGFIIEEGISTTHSGRALRNNDILPELIYEMNTLYREQVVSFLKLALVVKVFRWAEFRSGIEIKQFLLIRAYAALAFWASSGRHSTCSQGSLSPISQNDAKFKYFNICLCVSIMTLYFCSSSQNNITVSQNDWIKLRIKR